jgi:hypothetical protein
MVITDGKDTGVPSRPSYPSFKPNGDGSSNLLENVEQAPAPRVWIDSESKEVGIILLRL